MNYIRLVWVHPFGPHTVGLEGRAGYDCGVGPRSPGGHRFTQEMFLHYIGYATVYYRYYGERFRAGVSCASPREPAFRLLPRPVFDLRPGISGLVLRFPARTEVC